MSRGTARDLTGRKEMDKWVILISKNFEILPI